MLVYLYYVILLAFIIVIAGGVVAFHFIKKTNKFEEFEKKFLKRSIEKRISKRGEYQEKLTGYEQKITELDSAVLELDNSIKFFSTQVFESKNGGANIDVGKTKSKIRKLKKQKNKLENELYKYEGLAERYREFFAKQGDVKLTGWGAKECKPMQAEQSNRFCNSYVARISAIVLAVVFYLRFMLGRDVIENVISSSSTVLGLAPALNIIATLLIWLSYAGIFLLILFAFFNIKNLVNLVKYFATPVFILVALFMPFVVQGIIGPTPDAVGILRGVLMCLEVAIALGICVYVWYYERGFKLPKVEVKNLLFSIIPIILACTPAYALQALFGNADPLVVIDDLTFYHRIFIYMAILLPVAIYFGLRNKSAEAKRFAMLFLSLGTMFSFSTYYRFDILADPLSWPLHLCNTAMFIVPICLFFKWEKLFYFTYFINVAGALLAMMMPNYDLVNVTSMPLLRFWINHWCAFFMPILIVALGIYKRPKLKQFIFSMVAFLIYFVFILIINAWFSNYGSVDFFFVNSDFIAEKLGQWAEDLFDMSVTFSLFGLTFTFHPLYQILFYIVYIFIALAVWFIYEQFYNITDTWKRVRDGKKEYKQNKLELINALNGRGVNEPMSLDNQTKLVIEHFSKKYSSSANYAVIDANLQVGAGEVFGFLGPNGAGKSTIIKSIVGIQSITEGNIKICGYDVQRQPVQAKSLVGFVPDHYALYEKLTGREYINYIADIYGVSLEDRNERINKYVDIFALRGAFDNNMKTYSHGMKQKIAIIAALVHNPKLWILDEPLTGLDPTSIYQVKQCMVQHAKEGNIVFFSSHLIDVVENICTEIAIIKKGSILEQVSLTDLNKKGINLEQHYLEIIGDERDEAYLDIVKLSNLVEMENDSNKQTQQPKRVKKDKTEK